MASSSRNLARKSMTDLLGGAESSLSLRMSDGGRPVQRLKARLKEVINREPSASGERLHSTPLGHPRPHGVTAQDPKTIPAASAGLPVYRTSSGADHGGSEVHHVYFAPNAPRTPFRFSFSAAPTANS